MATAADVSSLPEASVPHVFPLGRVLLSSPRHAMSLGPCRLQPSGRPTGATAGAGMAINGGADCLKTPRELARRTAELPRLKQTRRDQERHAPEGGFGASTPSAPRPVKPTPQPTPYAKPPGARPGPAGPGRHAFDASHADRVAAVAAAVGARGPSGAGPLEDQGETALRVVDSRPGKAERILSRLPKGYGPRGERRCHPRAPGVLPKRLDGPPRLAPATPMPDLHGVPRGRGCDPTGRGPGRRVESFHRVAQLVARLPARRVTEDRQAPVTHADETSGRTNGPPGDAWRFATPRLRRCLFRQPRAASVPQAVLGTAPLPGCWGGDRDGGANQTPCARQEGSRHRRREVHALAQAFPAAAAVRPLVRIGASPLALAMGRRAQPLSEPAFSRQAAALQAQLIATLEPPAPPWGLRRLPALCRAHAERLDQGAEDRRLPADTNLAARELRPTVMARQGSGGSQSAAGARPRGMLRAVLHTLQRRQVAVVSHRKRVLDPLAQHSRQAPWPLLFPEGPT
jgi:hypothetical protein